MTVPSSARARADRTGRGQQEGVTLSDAIIINGVTKTFGPKLAVDNLSLRVPQGSVTGVIGPNGAGKTTTIRMIMSIIFPDSGTLEVLGRASAIESKDRIGYLPEERGLYRKMKVAALISYIARLKGIDSGAATRKTAQWLERVELSDVAKKRCEELSKGMQQKVQFIAAVIHQPELLILDEVFSGLDPGNRRLMRDLIDEQHKRGCTILFSTHAMYEAEQLCDRILMIHQGRKALDMPLQEVWRKFDPRSIVAEPLGTVDAQRYGAVPGVVSIRATGKAVEFGLADGASAPAVMSALVGGGEFRSVSLKRPSLEDIFIDIVEADEETLAALRQDRELAVAAGGAK
jgi:ABC-2 type transport system ATP-binding protein